MKNDGNDFRIDWNDNAVSKKSSPKPFGPLREYRIRFEKVAKGKRAVPDPMRLGVRSKLGGKPDWVQYPEIPKCPECKRRMTFVAQIDSMEHDEKHNPNAIDCMSDRQQYMYGDVGMIYVFMCYSCMTTQSVVQCG